jgi:tetratricopeptide (TPR) repeat protein
VSPPNHWRLGSLLAAAFSAAVAGCAHGRGGWRDEPSAEAGKACAGIAPLAVLTQEQTHENALARGQAFYCVGLFEMAVPVLTEQAIGFPVSIAIDHAIASPAPPALAADRLPALRWLVYIDRRFPGWGRVMEAVGEVARADLDRPEIADVRDDLHALAARFEYQRGRFDEALAQLRMIPASSPLRWHALLLEGAVHVRRSAPQPALTVFGEVLRSAPAEVDRDLAVISLARTYYAIGQFALAASYYDSVPPSSPHWADAAVEGAWTSYHMGDYARAVARIRTLAPRSGEVPTETMAEAAILEAVLAMHQCRRHDTRRAIDRFNEVYPVLFTEAKKLATRDAEALGDIGFSIRTGGTLAAPFDPAVLRRLLADVPVARRFDEIAEVDRELRRFGALEADWRPSGGGAYVRNALWTRRWEVRHEAGEQLRRRLQRFAEALAAQIKQSIRVEYEALQASSRGYPSDDDSWVCEQPQDPQLR